MSDYRDVLKTAFEQGFYLDSCGEEERHYAWGVYVDLCGLDPAEAAAGNWDGGEGGGSGKKKNTVTVAMEKDSNNEYVVVLNATYAPTADVAVSFTLDGAQETVTMPAGNKKFTTSLRGSNPSKPYAEIGGVTVVSDDEQYTYTAKNSVKTGMFTFTLNNNGQKTTEEVKYGTEITLPEATPREGYDFVWKDGNGNVISTPTVTMPEGNFSVTGSYVIKSYTLTYTVKEEYLENDELAERVYSTGSKVFKYNSGITTYLASLVSSRTGYSIDGWKEGDNAVPSKMPARDLEVTNKYKLNKHTVKFVSSGETVYEAERYFGASISTPADPYVEGYTFTGWDKTIPATMPNNDITFTARFTANTYYVRYYVDGSETYVDAYAYNSPVTIREDETRIGSTFSGWNPATLPERMPAYDIPVNGEFTLNNYSITFLSDGVEFSKVTGVYGDPIPDVGEPAKEGYTFTGWDNEVPATMPAEDVVLNAVFQINSHTLAYKVDGEDYETFTVEYGTALSLIDEPTKEGHTFSGWSDIPATMPDEDVTVTGTFSVNYYYAYYFVDEQPYASYQVAFGQPVPVAELPAGREGYTFTGWSPIPETMPADNMSISGRFLINSHILKYVLDGSDYSEETVEYGTVLTVKPDPVKEGHTFTGWVGLPETMPDADVTVTGGFSVNQYTLTFILDGEPYSSITADYGTAVSIDEPVKEGHSFSGWDGEVPQTVPAEDLVFNGTMNVNSYTATFVIDGEPSSAQTFQYGATVVYPVVTREGYVLRWNDIYSTMPARDVTIEGVFEEFTESKTVYYGMVLNSEIPTFSDFSGLTSFEYENGVEEERHFIIPGNPEYVEMEDLYNEDEITDEEWDAWLEAHKYGYVIVHPASTTFTIKNAGGVEQSNLFSQIGSTFDIEGTEYRMDARLSDSKCSGSDKDFKMRLTIVK